MVAMKNAKFDERRHAKHNCYRVQVRKSEHENAPPPPPSSPKAK